MLVPPKGGRFTKRNGVPGLADVPVFGFLFGNRDERAQASETIVMITPHVIRAASDGAPPADRENLQNAERMFRQQVDDLNRKLPQPAR